MKVVCSHCGLPFSLVRPAKDRAVFCCSGCALAARLLPASEVGGGMRSSGPLVVALSVGFVGFNQILFWLLSALLARRAEAVVGAEVAVDTVDTLQLAWVSLGLGAAVWLAIVVIQWRLGARRAEDGLVGLLGAALLALAFWSVSPACAFAASATQAAWALRGFNRKQRSQA